MGLDLRFRVLRDFRVKTVEERAWTPEGPMELAGEGVRRVKRCLIFSQERLSDLSCSRSASLGIPLSPISLAD